MQFGPIHSFQAGVGNIFQIVSGVCAGFYGFHEYLSADAADEQIIQRGLWRISHHKQDRYGIANLGSAPGSKFFLPNMRPIRELRRAIPLPYPIDPIFIMGCSILVLPFRSNIIFPSTSVLAVSYNSFTIVLARRSSRWEVMSIAVISRQIQNNRAFGARMKCSPRIFGSNF